MSKGGIRPPLTKPYKIIPVFTVSPTLYTNNTIICTKMSRMVSKMQFCVEIYYYTCVLYMCTSKQMQVHGEGETQ